MKQIERLKHIVDLLNQKPQNINGLQKYFSGLKIEVSNRQLYRDIDDIGNYMLRKGEILEFKHTSSKNEKTWSIIHKANVDTITTFDINTFQISQITNPACLDGRKSSLENINSLLRDNLSSSKFEYSSNWDNLSLYNTHFYEASNDLAYQKHLDDIIWVTSNHYKIKIEEYLGDSVSLYKSVKLPFEFHPIKIIYHRGSFFIAGINALSDQVLVLDVSQIAKFKNISTTFSYKRKLKQVEENLKNRFGITQNINNEVYNIVLEFSSVTGVYVKNHNWHHSERFTKIENGNFQLSLECGINRELLGWIYQWMGNVKIIEPIELKDFYLLQLNKIKNLLDGSELIYSNIFQPR